MLIEFNEIGVLTSANTESDILRQGTTSNVLTARFTTKNTDYTASFNFTRSDGKSISGVIMNIENSNNTDYKYKFSDEWFFAKSGETTLTIYLHNGSGDVVASGQYKFNIESTDYDDEPTIKISQYNEIVAELQKKVDKTDYAGHIENYNQLVDEVSKKANQSDLELLQAELETSYRKKEEQDKIDKEKTNTYIVSCLQPEPTRDSYGKGWTLSDMDGNSFQTYDEFIEYVGDAIYSNGLLNSVADSISLYDGRNHYLVTEDYKIILITNRVTDVLKKGDIIAVKEPNVPNRWCFGGSTLYKLGSIIDETSVANKDYVDTELSALKDKVFDVISTTYEENIATDSYSVPSNFDGHSLIKSVPCEVKSIKGNSVAFNSIKTNGNFANTSGWAFENATMVVSNNVLTLTANGNNQVDLYTNNIPMVANHKYIVSFTLKNSNNGHLWINLLNGDTFAQILSIQNTIAIGTTENRYSYIFTCPQTLNGRIFIYTYQKTDLSGGETSQFKNFNLHDLTLMGLDSITSVEEFNHIFPLTYYPYNAGEIKSVKVSKIESWGYNLFDGELRKGYYTNGNYISSNNSICNVNPIKVEPCQTYTLERNITFIPSADEMAIVEYDENMNFIKKTGVNTATNKLTLTSNTHYCNWWIYKSGIGATVPTQEQAQVCFHLTGSRTGYAPYVGKLGTITLPTITTIDGVNSVKDTLTFEEQENGTYNAIITRRIGVDDLGTLNWTLYTGLENQYIYWASIPTIKLGNGLTCSKLVQVQANYNNAEDYSISLHPTLTRVYAKLTNSITTPSAFKTAMSGVMLYYELATPTTEVIATGLTHEQVSMLFEIGGSIINDNENTEYNAQATTTIDFACKDWSI